MIAGAEGPESLHTSHMLEACQQSVSVSSQQTTWIEAVEAVSFFSTHHPSARILTLLEQWKFTASDWQAKQCNAVVTLLQFCQFKPAHGSTTTAH